MDVLAGNSNSLHRDQQSNIDALRSQQEIRLRNFRSRSGLVSNSHRAEDSSLSSRGLPRANNLPDTSRSNARLNLRLRPSQRDSVASSLPSQLTSFSRSSPVNHQGTSISNPDLHNAQRETSRTRQSFDFQSALPGTLAGNDARNQASAQDAQLMRELQLLNSLLKENGNPVHTDQLSNQNTVHSEFGTVANHQFGNINNQIHQQPQQLPSIQTHDFSSLTQSHLGLEAQPKIVLLRNRNSAKPLNVQIGNTRLEVLGGQSDSSQLIIQTLQNALGSATTNTAGSPNVISNVQGNSAVQVPSDNLSLINTPANAQQATGQVGANQIPPNTSTILELLKQLQPSSITSGNTGSNNQIKPSVTAANVPGPVNINNIQIPQTTTAPPVPIVTTPLTPSGALRQILGPGVSDAMLQKMAQEILPSELQRIDAIMTGRGQNQGHVTQSDPSNVGILKVGNQTHTFDIGTTKKIKIEQYNNGPRAEVTSIHGSGVFRHRMVTEEPPEYDEILLRKVLQKMSGR